MKKFHISIHKAIRSMIHICMCLKYSVGSIDLQILLKVLEDSLTSYVNLHSGREEFTKDFQVVSVGGCKHFHVKIIIFLVKTKVLLHYKGRSSTNPRPSQPWWAVTGLKILPPPRHLWSVAVRNNNPSSALVTWLEE